MYIPNADNALGTAYLAGMALGMFDSFDTVRDQWLKEKQVIRPDPENAERYDRCFAFYQKLNALIRPAYRELAGLE